MPHVRELVPDHALELVVGQVLQDAFRRGHRRVAGAAARGECVRREIRDHVDTRHGQRGALRQPLDDLVQPVAGPDFLCPIHAEDDLVREPVRAEVHRDNEEEHHDEALAAADGFADDEQEPAEEAEKQRGFQCVRHC